MMSVGLAFSQRRSARAPEIFLRAMGKGDHGQATAFGLTVNGGFLRAQQSQLVATFHHAFGLGENVDFLPAPAAGGFGVDDF